MAGKKVGTPGPWTEPDNTEEGKLARADMHREDAAASLPKKQIRILEKRLGARK